MNIDSFPKSLRLHDNNLKKCILCVQDATRTIWEQRLHKNYTRHGLDHSEKIITILGDLLDSNPNLLNEHERFVIIASIYLHDVGMQFPKYSGLQKKVEYSNQELELIRENHHEASANLILDSVSADCDISLGLGQCNEYVKFIAEVSRYHRKLPLSELKNKSFVQENIRIPLLAALLRIGDELHVDFSRVNMTILKMWEIPIESKFHWWSHYYVQNVSCKNGIIELYFRFPREYESNGLCQVMINKITLSIQREFQNVYDILCHYGLRIYSEIKINEEYQYSDDIVPIPEDLLKYIKENILKIEENTRRLNLVTSLSWVVDGVPYSDDADIVKSMSRIIKLVVGQNNTEAIKEIETARNLIIAPWEKMIFCGIAGNCYFIVGDLEKSERYFADALEISNRKDLKEIFTEDVSATRAAALGNLGYIYIIKGNPDKGISNFMAALDIAKLHANKIGEAVLLNNIGWFFAEQGKTSEAYKYLNRALKLNRVSGYRQGEAKTLGTIGHLLHMEGKTAEGMDFINESLDINKEISNLEGVASDYGLLGIISQNIERYDEAIQNFKKALVLHKKIGFKLGMVNDLGNIGTIYRLKKQFNRAMKIHNLALKFSREIGYTRGEGIQLHGLGNIYKDMGNLDKAMECYNEGLDKFRMISYKQGIATLLTNIGAIRRKKGNFATALEVYKESLNISREIGSKQGQSKTCIGSMYIEQKDYKG